MTPFDGTWRNSYGSLLRLSSDGERLSGHYCSSTGSTGEYRVLGFGSEIEPSADGGSGIAIGIYWRSFGQGPGDPSWHWVSGMAGQVLLQDGGEKSLVLNHLMVATGDFPGLADAATYPDKLVFAPAADVPSIPFPAGKRWAGDPIEGTWVCPSTGIELEIALRDSESGWVEGTFAKGGRRHAAHGFADTFAKGCLGREALTFCASTGGGRYLDLAGYLAFGTDTLEVFRMVSTGTAPGNAYLQTSLQSLSFFRK
jgi:saccharopepsin